MATQDDEPKMRKVVPKRYNPNMPVMASETKEKKIYPKFDIDFKSLPEAKKYEMNDVCHIEIKAKLVGMQDNEYASNATFEILEIGIESEDGNEGSDNENN